MPKYTTSYAKKKRPRYVGRSSNQHVGGRPRKVRKPGAQYLRHSQGFGRRAGLPVYAKNARRPYALIAVGCALLLFVASLVWYANRGVPITLNGEAASARIHSTITQFIDSKNLELKPGRLLAVDDEVLDKTGGERVSVTLNGKKVPYGKLDSTEISAEDKLEIHDGADTYEKHTVQATTIEPKLVLRGTGPIQYVKTWGDAGRSEVWTGEVSGKTKDRGVVKKSTDALVLRRSASPSAKGKKYVALTLDKAPSAQTDKVLSVLSGKGVHATFFMSAETARKYPEAARAVADGGNEVGVNLEQECDPKTMSKDELRAQIQDAKDAVHKATGKKTELLRPPYGTYPDEAWAKSMDLISGVATWNVDSGDWTLKGAQSVVDSVMGTVSNGDIVLLTDNDEMEGQTADALSLLIDALHEKGFEIVTLSELVKTDKSLAKDIGSLYAVKPPKSFDLPSLGDDTAPVPEAPDAPAE